MDINMIPQEIWEEVGLFLDIPDILSCCLVCLTWRNVFNNNRIWSRLCWNKYYVPKGVTEILIKENNIVKPGFIAPENNFCWLTDICQWRIRFMQEVHITRNWRKGRFVSEMITTIKNGETEVECDGNMLVIPHVEKRRFSLWNIDNLHDHKSEIPFSLMNMTASFFKLCKEKVVITQCTLLQVFSKTEENDFVMNHRFLFNKSLEASRSIPNYWNITAWYDSNVGLYPCDITMCCDHDGKYFVGVILEGDLDQALLHIWDLTTGKKCLQQSLPEVYNVTDIRFTMENSKVILFVKVKENNENCTKVFCYDLNLFNYTDMQIHLDYAPPAIQVQDPYILTVDKSGRNIFLWQICDGKLVHKLSNENHLNLMIIQFVSSRILFCEYSPAADIVKVFCTKTLKTINAFNAGCRVKHFMLIRFELILIKSPGVCGLWDIITGCMLHRFEDYSFCNFVTRRVSDNDSRIVTNENNNELYLFHFW